MRVTETCDIYNIPHVRPKYAHIPQSLLQPYMFLCWLTEDERKKELESVEVEPCE